MKKIDEQNYYKFWNIEQPVFSRYLHGNEIFTNFDLSKELERLVTIARQPHSLAIVTSYPGHGKSTIARWLYDSIAATDYKVMLFSIVEPITTYGWLTRQFAKFLGLSLDPQAPKSELFTRTLQSLDDYSEHLLKLVIVIDSAHLLKNEEAFLEIYQLLNLQSLTNCFASFVLIGNVELHTTLYQHKHLTTSISVKIPMELLDFESTNQYICHRLELAKLSTNVFEVNALKDIYKISHGNFSKINSICENCLIEGYFENTYAVDQSIVETAARHLVNENHKKKTLKTDKKPSLNQPQGPSAPEHPTDKKRSSVIKLTSLFKDDDENGGKTNVS